MRESPADLSLTHYPALRDAFQRVSDLDSLAEKYLLLCSAMKRGVWLRESDLASPVDHNLNLDIFQIASSLRGHILTGWVRVESRFTTILTSPAGIRSGEHDRGRCRCRPTLGVHVHMCVEVGLTSGRSGCAGRVSAAAPREGCGAGGERAAADLVRVPHPTEVGGSHSVRSTRPAHYSQARAAGERTDSTSTDYT